MAAFREVRSFGEVRCDRGQRVWQRGARQDVLASVSTTEVLRWKTGQLSRALRVPRARGRLAAARGRAAAGRVRRAEGSAPARDQRARRARDRARALPSPRRVRRLLAVVQRRPSDHEMTLLLWCATLPLPQVLEQATSSGGSVGAGTPLRPRLAGHQTSGASPTGDGAGAGAAAATVAARPPTSPTTTSTTRRWSRRCARTTRSCSASSRPVTHVLVLHAGCPVGVGGGGRPHQRMSRRAAHVAAPPRHALM